MPKRTYQPKKRRRLKRLGYRARKKSPSGKRILKRRIKKGRKRVTVSDEFRKVRKNPRNKRNK
jgi:large subunit ribosomal protein L34